MQAQDFFKPLKGSHRGGEFVRHESRGHFHVESTPVCVEGLAAVEDGIGFAHTIKAGDARSEPAFGFDARPQSKITADNRPVIVGSPTENDRALIGGWRVGFEIRAQIPNGQHGSETQFQFVARIGKIGVEHKRQPDVSRVDVGIGDPHVFAAVERHRNDGADIGAIAGFQRGVLKLRDQSDLRAEVVIVMFWLPKRGADIHRIHAIENHVE